MLWLDLFAGVVAFALRPDRLSLSHPCLPVFRHQQTRDQKPGDNEKQHYAQMPRVADLQVKMSKTAGPFIWPSATSAIESALKHRVTVGGVLPLWSLKLQAISPTIKSFRTMLCGAVHCHARLKRDLFQISLIYSVCQPIARVIAKR